MKSILIIGSSGKIGKYLTSRFDDMFHVTVLSRNTSPFFYDFDKKTGNIDGLKKLNFDYIINCLGVLPSKRVRDQSFYNINSSSINILSECVNSSAIFINLSTISVYGESIKHRNIIENDIVNPKNIYAKSKLKGEELVSEKFKTFINFRIPPVYLDYNDSTLYKRIIKNDLFEIVFNNDDQLHSFCSLNTLYQTLLKYINNPCKNGVYHLCDKRLISIKDLKSYINKKPLVKLKIKDGIFEFLMKISKILKLEKLNSKINEIHFKACLSNIYSTKKIEKFYDL